MVTWLAIAAGAAAVVGVAWIVIVFWLFRRARAEETQVGSILLVPGLALTAASLVLATVNAALVLAGMVGPGLL